MDKFKEGDIVVWLLDYQLVKQLFQVTFATAYIVTISYLNKDGAWINVNVKNEAAIRLATEEEIKAKWLN